MPKEIRHTLVLLGIAACFLGGAVWQGQVASAREFAHRSRTLPPTAKTRRAVRPAPVPFTGDPVADYAARCEKGMTDQEILWILDDYKNAGLDLGIHDIELKSGPPPEDPYRPYHNTLRKAQDRWFLEALVDGLRLSPEQIAQTRSTFDRLFDQAKADLIQDQNAELHGSPGDGPISPYRGVDRLTKLISLDRYLNGGEHAPWILLSPQQEKLTWKHIISQLADRASRGQAAAAEKLVVSEPEFLGAEPMNLNQGDPNVPGEYMFSNIFLPFLKCQKLASGDDPFAKDPFTEDKDPPAEDKLLLAEYEDRLVANVRKFHPAQLKMCLLFDPEMTGRVQHALDSASH